MVIARRPWSRCYVVIVPILLYALWYAGWGHVAESHLSLRNVVHSPIYLLKGLAASASALVGVPNSVRASVAEGRLPLVPLIVAALIPLVAAVVLRKRLRVPLPPRSGVPWWSSSHSGYSRQRTMSPDGRHGRRGISIVGAVLLLMVLASLASGIRVRGAAILTALVVGGVAAIANLRVLNENYQDPGRPGDPGARRDGGVRDRRRQRRSQLHYTPGQHRHHLALFARGRSLPVGVHAFGSPAYSASELARAPEEARVAGDQLLAKAEELRPVTVDRPPPPGGPHRHLAGGTGATAAPKGSCLTVPGGGPSPPVDLPRPGVTVSGPRAPPRP